MSRRHRSDNNDGGNNNNNSNNRNNWSATKLSCSSYKDLGSPSDVVDRFYQHLIKCCNCDIIALLQTTCNNNSRDYSIHIQIFDLLQNDPILGFLLLKYPTTLLPLLERAIVLAQQQEMIRIQQQDTDDNSNDDWKQWHVKGDTTSTLSTATSGGGGEGTTTTTTTRVHARLQNLPPTCCKPTLGSSLSSHDVGKIWQVTGTVVRTGTVQMYESARTYRCCGVKSNSGGGWRNNKQQKQNNNNNNQQAAKQTCCGRTYLVHADLEQRNNALQPPERCPGTIMQNGKSQPCPGNKFQVVEGGSVHTDYQEIKIQDAANNCCSQGGGMGHIPRSLLIKLQHDLVDRCQPGDEVVVVGILLAQWQQPFVVEGMDCSVGMAMSAHSVRVIAEKGSSVWKDNTTATTSGGSANSGGSVGEMDKFRKEFRQYWEEPKNVEYPMAARDFICKAVCPKLYGMQIVKLALLITLIGGVSSEAYEVEEDDDSDRTDPKSRLHVSPNEFEPEAFQLEASASNKQNTATAYYGDTPPNRSKKSNRPARVKTRRRDQSHLLLVGDPGTGKSQFLRFAAALCPRSVLTTGVGTTSAGLTCAAVREGSGKEFALEAGALVLADKGVCCIDEFGCIREADRTTIHEAMEQQTLSVAKAGIVCKLNCRATIIAVMNPRDCLYDNHASLSVNTGLGTPLLSRFDLIFKLVDSSDAERDSKVTTYLLNRAIQGEGFDVSDSGTDGQVMETPWSMEKLRAYISIVKEGFTPRMSEEAALLLERHYEKCRSSQSNTIPITVRFLESLIRLSQAHSRLMHRASNTVTLEDAVAIIQVMECTAFAYGGFDGTSIDDIRNVLYVDPMTIDFSPEADLDFLFFEYRILERYGMLNYMDDDSRKKAMAALGTSGSNHDAGGSWHDVESKQFVPNGSFPPETPSPSVTQDHYGRFHPGSTQTQNKRPRL